MIAVKMVAPKSRNLDYTPPALKPDAIRESEEGVDHKRQCNHPQTGHRLVMTATPDLLHLPPHGSLINTFLNGGDCTPIS